MSSLEFSNLPLIAVNIQIVRTAPIVLSLEVVFQLKEILSRRFSRVESMPHMIAAPGVESFQLSMTEVPGVRFLTDTQDVFAVVQQRSVHVGWTTDPQSSAGYPRFAKLAEVTQDVIKALNEVDSEGAYSVVSMSYDNWIHLGHHPSVSDVQTFVNVGFSDNAVRPIHEVQLAWRVPNSRTDARIAVVAGRRDAASDVDGFVLRTSAGVQFEGVSDPSTQLNEIHDYLQRMFSDFITDLAKESWGYDRVR